MIPDWIQKQRSDKYLKYMEVNRIRPKAEEAWHNKRYDEFIQLYEPIQNTYPLLRSRN